MTEKNTNLFERAFEQPAFISYIVAGDPSPDDTIEIAKALIDGPIHPKHHPIQVCFYTERQ